MNSQGKEIENATSETISLLLSNDGEEDSKLQQWHLVHNILIHLNCLQYILNINKLSFKFSFSCFLKVHINLNIVNRKFISIFLSAIDSESKV